MLNSPNKQILFKIKTSLVDSTETHRETNHFLLVFWILLIFFNQIYYIFYYHFLCKLVFHHKIVKKIINNKFLGLLFYSSLCDMITYVYYIGVYYTVYNIHCILGVYMWPIMIGSKLANYQKQKKKERRNIWILKCRKKS